MSLATVITPRTKVTVPLVRINIVSVGNAGGAGTNRVKFVPIYEAPLLKELHGDTVRLEIARVAGLGPGARPWPAEMQHKVTTMAAEEARLARLYKEHPQTKRPIYDSVYGFGRFAGEFRKVVGGSWAAEEVYSPEVQDPDAETDEALLRSRTPTLHPEASKPVEAPVAAEEKEPTVAEAAEELLIPVHADARAAAVKALTAALPSLSTTLAGALVDAHGVYSVDEVATLGFDELESVKGIGPAKARKIMAEAAAATAPPPAEALDAESDPTV